MRILRNRLGVAALKRPTPNSELAFKVAAQRAGWTVFKKGWPDFMCIKDGQIMVVEVKHGSDKLSLEQKAMLRVLSNHGIRCFEWRESTGFRRLFKQQKV